MRRPPPGSARACLCTVTLCTRARVLDFIYQAATRAPILSAAIRHGEGVYRRRHGASLDLTRGWWTPPLGPHDAWLLEKSQIEALDQNAIVSITDHDNIEAPVSLQVLDECRGTPISVEWTVPFGPTFFHLGVHNLPAGEARMLWAEMDSYRQKPDEARLHEILTALGVAPSGADRIQSPVVGRTRDRARGASRDGAGVSAAVRSKPARGGTERSAAMERESRSDRTGTGPFKSPSSRVATGMPSNPMRC